MTTISRKPKVLLNGSTMFDGGGMQVLVNFILELQSQESQIDWYYLITERVEFFLNVYLIKLPINKKLVLRKSPSSISAWFTGFYEFKKWEKEIEFDLVYSISSPSYFFFKSKEIQRITNPYIANPNEWGYKALPFKTMILRNAKTKFQELFLKKSDLLITQTNLAKNNLIKKFSSISMKVEVVPNAISSLFISNDFGSLPKENYIFCIGAANWHKNIHLLPEVALKLKNFKPELKFKFLTTLDKESVIFHILVKNSLKLGVEDYFIHLGRISQLECKEYYLRSKVTFLPTCLEVFSASIIESIHFKTPVLTTNLDFNRELIGNSKFLFQSGNWDQAAQMLFKFLTDPNYGYEMLESVSKELKVITSFTALKKTEQLILEIIEGDNEKK